MKTQSSGQPAYQSGFGNYFSSEVEAGILPIGRNSPQRVARGLYAEQLSGSAFTALNHENLRSWLYRRVPSVKHSTFIKINEMTTWHSDQRNVVVTPNQLRWDAFARSETPHNFIEGIYTYAVAGSCGTQVGSAAHMYSVNRSMQQKAFFNADAEMLIVPQLGELEFITEFGVLHVRPGEIIVIPRGVRFSVNLLQENFTARGYICENFGGPFQLPYRGPIGANGLANTRDFLYPVANHNPAEFNREFILFQKFGGQFFRATLDYSPFDVLAWHGNYAPYKYDLNRFNTIGSISYDHPDPSIFTVLTSPSMRPGVANVDFVIFPPRWLVAENTFRPPWYHRNIMSEFMGLIHGVYDAKPDGGFVPGGASLHNCMNAHGPDQQAFVRASEAKLAPQKVGDTMAFMFESSLTYLPTAQSLARDEFQDDYLNCWHGLVDNFEK